MKLVEKIKRHGVRESFSVAWYLAKRKVGYIKWKHRNAPEFLSPTEDDLIEIERRLLSLGIQVHDYELDLASFNVFCGASLFPVDYHGGANSGVWTEKLLEHWVSQDLLALESFGSNDVYVDIAAASSPWAKIQRDVYGISAFANDLVEVGGKYSHLEYYRVEDATASAFSNSSVSGASLHCAFEMFAGNADTALVQELARILKPGAKAVILPLYMHTHYCAYSTPEYFNKGHSDLGAKEYIRLDARGVPSSRKYSPEMLNQRVLGPIKAAGLKYKIYVLRNKADIGADVYCHFILEIQK